MLRPQFVLIAVLLAFLWICPFVSAFDAGDGICLMLGLTLTIMGFCACLGAYARKRAADASHLDGGYA
ncbi:hypothetical protein RvY_06361 [Ramazzottius varieornatus]|uniref:Uncharacterized protein n=1 Tax=Ramazzottius varieornatus TaxID=947166 RepID=A0A1D1V711_RAMVA|nr:hypothetical protein RvY_06361 [Ramazzottius varieornatus]